MDAGNLDRFYLDDQLIEPRKGKVSRRNEERHLPPKAAEVLVCLAQRPGEVLSHDEILAQVWGPGNGSKEALSHAISDIRHALGDLPNRPRFIQTLPKRGYRLLQSPSGSPGSAPAQVPAMEAPEWWERLLRHGVVQAAVAYVVAGWVLVQVADTTFDKIGLPPWSEQFVTFTVISGFPIVVLLAWCLEFVKGRIELDRGDQPIGLFHGLARNYLAIVIAYGIAAMGTGVYQATIGFSEIAADVLQDVAAAEAVPIEENSIAVLPFLNNDGSQETQIFANGLMDDVITRLSRVPGLLVSSRGDAATLLPNTSSDTVRKRLRVAMYLEGSVEIHGEQIRVIMQLIDSANGFHILSRTFDRPKADFFAIRDEVTQLTVSSLRVTLPDDNRGLPADADQEPGLDTYLLYRRGADLLNQPPTADSIGAALGWFDAALSVDPEYAAAHAGRCRAFAWQLADTHDVRFAPQAEAACAEALELNPNLDIVHAALGRMYVETGRHNEAEVAFQDALRINENNVDAMLGLSEVYRLQNRPQAAETMLDAAVGLQPGNWSTYANLGIFYYRQGRFSEAAEQFAEVVSINPSYVRGYSNLAASYMMAGDFSAALATYRQSLDIRADRLTYANLGMMSYYLGRYDEAEAALRKAIEMGPERHLSWSNLGDVLFVAGNLNEARDAYSTAAELLDEQFGINSGDPTIYMDHAWIHAMLGERDEALLELSRALAAAPDDPYASYYEGLIYYQFDDTDLALAALERAVNKGYPKMILKTEPLLTGLRGNTRFAQITMTDDTRREE